MTLDEWIRHTALTQRQVSKLLDVTPSTVSRIVNGIRAPSAKLIRRIVAESGGLVTSDELLGIEHWDGGGTPATKAGGNRTANHDRGRGANRGPDAREQRTRVRHRSTTGRAIGR